MALYHHPRRVDLAPRPKLSFLELVIVAGAVIAACLAGFASQSFLPL